jgi:hypothetical protein
MDLLLCHSFPLHPSGCILTSGMVGELVGDAHNTRPITFFPGPFPNAFRATPLIIHPNPSHDTMSSTILDLHPSSRPSRSPKNKCSLANNAFCAPASPANRSSTILARAEKVYPASPAPVTPASAIPLPRGPSFVSSRLLWVFRRPSLTRVGFQPSVNSAESTILSASFLHFVDILQTPVHSIPATLFPADAKFAVFGYPSIFVDITASTPNTPSVCTVVRWIPAPESGWTLANTKVRAPLQSLHLEGSFLEDGGWTLPLHCIAHQTSHFTLSPGNLSTTTKV